MADVRIHRYRVDPADMDELLERRATLIDLMRAAFPGLADTRLTRLQDGTFTDAWRWESADHMQAAIDGAPTIPEIKATMSLVRDHTAEDGQIVDER